nr:hypothetical protein [Tanacetum cinerariifolium]
NAPPQHVHRYAKLFSTWRLSIGIRLSLCSVESLVVNISESSTNKAFQTLEDSLDLESSLDYFHKLFTPPFIILRPDSIIHARIVLVQPEVFDHMIQLVQDSCQRTITKHVHLILPQHLLLIISIFVDHSPWVVVVVSVVAILNGFRRGEDVGFGGERSMMGVDRGGTDVEPR